MEVDDTVYRGRYAAVYDAQLKSTGERVAIKTIEKRKLSEKQKERLYDEFSIMSMCRHPNIVRTRNHFENDEFYFIVMEFMAGGELFNRIKKKTFFNEAEARYVITRLVRAVDYLHSNGIVHRDIKPENILLSEDSDTSEVKLADFGVSKVIYNGVSETPCGTVGYVAPEIVVRQPHSMKTDMWSIGCILFTLLCGYPPFYDSSTRETLRLVKEGRFAFQSPWWDEVSNEAKDLITHLLVVQAERRYSAKEMLAHPWMQAERVSLVSLKAPATMQHFTNEVGDVNQIIALANQAVREQDPDDEERLKQTPQPVKKIRLDISKNPIVQRRGVHFAT
eukprot:Colp12_sorted_trinity150504_noHs@26891